MSRIVVLGGGESGVGSAVLAKSKGYDVFLSDMGKISEEYADVLQEWNIPFEQGKHSEDLILNADEVIKSPGIPTTAPMVQKITERGIDVISEIEFAAITDASNELKNTIDMIHKSASKDDLVILVALVILEA